MAWREIHMRGGSKEELARKVKKAKELMMEICEDVEEMDDEDFGERGEYGERGGEWEARGGYGERDYGERMGERRSMRTGRYIRG